MWDVLGYLNQNAGAAQVLLTFGLVVFAAVSGVAAWLGRGDTNRLAQAAKQQADASVKMAEEMQKQRLESLRPIIDVVLPRPKEHSHDDYLLQEYVKVSMFPKEVDCKVSNVGVGPALALQVSILHPRQVFETSAGGTLAKASTSIIRLVQQTGREAEQSGPVSSSVVATYTDVYKRKWKSQRDVSFDVDESVIRHGQLMVTALEGSHDS